MGGDEPNLTLCIPRATVTSMVPIAYKHLGYIESGTFGVVSIAEKPADQCSDRQVVAVKRILLQSPAYKTS